MATALRCLMRVATREVLTAPSVGCLKVFSKQFHARNSPYIKDVDVSKLPEFETSNDPNEWKYVERLLALETIPEPKKIDGNAASGWKPPQLDKALQYPYFIRRTKNHMQPVYFHYSKRGNKQITLIRRIDGDIWQLEKDLKTFLNAKYEQKHKKSGKTTPYLSTIFSRVNEMSCQIRFRGDYVALVKMWMDERGF